jgi:thiol:disulfide interchange protein DsbD
LANKKKFDQAHAQLPLYQPAQAHLSGTLNSERFVLQIEGLQLDRANLEILPAKNGLIDYLAPVEVHANGSVIEVSLKRSDRLTANVEHFPAVIKSANQAYAVDFPIRVEMKQATSSGVQARNQMSTANSVLAHSEASADFSNVVLPVLFAFLGGLLLNLMPCVFPVLSIKVMGLLKMSGQSRSQVLINGWSYTVGILVSFWLLVAALLFLRVGGRQIGWGFQLQSPQFVFSLACFLFIFSLNLMGLFELSGRFLGRVTTAGDSLTRRSGWVGSFFTGVLATLVATPCSAPFMGSAVGFAISQPPSVIFIIFTSLGLGLALPYLLICYVPWFAKVLPRPGAWMHTFQELMAFALLATVVWLVWVLSFQVASSGLVVLFLTFTALSFLVWLYRRFEKLAWLSLGLGVAIVVLASRTLTIADLHQRLSETTVQKGDLVWQKFAPEKIAQYQAAGRPVFIDFTAAWCVSCQVNEALIFHSEAVTSKIKQMNFVLMKADWTNEDPVITQALHAFGRDGVPYYVIYPKGSGAALVALPEVLNASIVLDALEKLPL